MRQLLNYKTNWLARILLLLVSILVFQSNVSATSIELTSSGFDSSNLISEIYSYDEIESSIGVIGVSTGHLAGGTTAGVLRGKSLDDAFTDAVDGVGPSMLMGMAVGVVSAVGASYANRINPVTGKKIPVKANPKLPTQTHHFATNKHSVFTKEMSAIAKQFGLDLDGAWNKQALPHLGRHPNNYHEFVLDGMRRASFQAGGSQAKFLQLFDQYVKQPVINNPQLLRKAGWQ